MKRYGLILFSIPLLIFLILYFVFDFNGLYGQDGHEYYRYTNELKTSIHLGVKPQPFFWPLGYPFLGAIISYPFGDSVFFLQLISVFSLSISGWFLYGALQSRVGSGSSFWLVLLSVTTSGYLVRSGMIVMSDSLCVACLSGVIFFNEKLNRSNGIWSVVGLAVCASLAVMTRYPSVVLLVPLACWIGYKWLLAKQWLNFLIVCSVMLIIACPHIILRSQDVFGFLGHGWLVNWSTINFFARDFYHFDGNHHYMVPNIIFVLKPLGHPGFLGLLGCSWICSKKADFKNVYFLSIVLYLLFIAGIAMQNTRFMILASPFVVYLMAPSFNLVYTKFQTYIIGVGIFLVVVNMVLIVIALKPFVEQNQLEKEIARELRLDKNDKVYSFGIDVALKSYLEEINWLDMYKREIESPNKNAYILFNPTKFEAQWKDEVLFKNWHIFEKSGVKVKQELNNGWTLYEFK